MATRNKPGVVSDVIQRLRERAMEEMDAEERGRREVADLTFDASHDAPDLPPFNPDVPLGLPPNPGYISPHIGNGSGPPM